MLGLNEVGWVRASPCITPKVSGKRKTGWRWWLSLPALTFRGVYAGVGTGVRSCAAKGTSSGDGPFAGRWRAIVHEGYDCGKSRMLSGSEVVEENAVGAATVP